MKLAADSPRWPSRARSFPRPPRKLAAWYHAPSSAAGGPGPRQPRLRYRVIADSRKWLILHSLNAERTYSLAYIRERNQCSYTAAVEYKKYGVGSDEVHDLGFCYGSHEYILKNFPQEVAPGSNRTTGETSIRTESGDAICWKVTIPKCKQDSILKRLDRMSINKYALFRSEDTLVETYGSELTGRW